MSLKKDFTLGIFYTSVAKYSGLIIQVVITAILARLLTPADFGVVAIATVLIQFFNTISEAGIGPAIIQKKELTSGEIDAIFTFTVLLGLLLSLIFYLCSGLIAQYYDNDALVMVCRLLSVLILFSSIDIVTNSLLLKQKKFKAIAIRTVAVQLVVGALSIYFAYEGWGMYALVFSAIASKVVIFIVNYCYNPLKINFQFGCLAKIRSYSFYQFCFNIVNYFSRNADKLIVGKFIGMSQLGYYEKSYRLMMLPLSNITYVFTPVMHPIFSELQNERERMFANYLKLIKILGILSFPVTVFLFFNARELVLIFFGNQWEASVLPFKILSLTAALQIIHATSGGIFQAIDDTKGLFIVSFITACLMVGGFIISAACFHTIEAVAYSFLITCTLSSLILFQLLFHRFGYGLVLFFSILKPSILLGLVEFAVLACMVFFLPSFGLIADFVIKTIAIGLMTMIYVATTKTINIKEFLKIFRK